MSTEWVYVCVSHDPPLAAGVDDEMGHASRGSCETDAARRLDLLLIPDFVWDEFDVPLPRHWRWLRLHRNCTVELEGDNGQGTVGRWAPDGTRLDVIVDAAPVVNSKCALGGRGHVFSFTGPGDPVTCDCGQVYYPLDVNSTAGRPCVRRTSPLMGRITGSSR